jgi:hypothetical protein
MRVTKKAVASLLLPLLVSSGSIAALSVSPSMADTATSHSMMATHTWTGKVTAAHAMMGMHESFGFVVDMKTYTVDYTTLTKFGMGDAKMIKAGVHITVSGTLKGKVITATALNI